MSQWTGHLFGKAAGSLHKESGNRNGITILLISHKKVYKVSGTCLFHSSGLAFAGEKDREDETGLQVHKIPPFLSLYVSLYPDICYKRLPPFFGGQSFFSSSTIKVMSMVGFIWV